MISTPNRAYPEYEDSWLLCLIAHLQCTDQGCTALVNGEIYEKETASPPGQFIALQAINVLKGIISG